MKTNRSKNVLEEMFFKTLNFYLYGGVFCVQLLDPLLSLCLQGTTAEKIQVCLASSALFTCWQEPIPLPRPRVLQ